MNKVILLIVPVLTLLTTAATQHQQQQIAHATPIKTNLGTTVQAQTGNGFDNGYNKGRADSLNDHIFGDLCSPASTYCNNYQMGYITGWVEMHLATGTPFDMKLLNANETA